MTERKGPLVSVIIPAYNARKYLPEALGSVFGQTYRPIEVIVVDDGSTDGTAEAVESYRTGAGIQDGSTLVCMRQQNAGPSAARNRGILAAKGAYITFLDSDDLWPSGKLSRQVELMEANPDAGLVFGDVQRFTEGAETRASMFRNKGLGADFFGKGFYVDRAFEKLLVTNYIPTGTVMLRAGFEEKAGLFDEGFRQVEDIDLWCRVALRFRIGYSTDVWEYKRDHASNVSNDSEGMQETYIRVLEKMERELSEEMRSRGVSIDRCFAEAYLRLGRICMAKDSASRARRYLWKSFKKSPRPGTLMRLVSTFARSNGGIE